MARKVAADSMAYRVTLRKYEEGLSSAIDLQTAANTLIEARANLLQKQLSYEIKRRLVAYYNQGELICEDEK
jgi:outer membrane efflux protein